MEGSMYCSSALHMAPTGATIPRSASGMPGCSFDSRRYISARRSGGATVPPARPMAMVRRNCRKPRTKRTMLAEPLSSDSS